MTCFHFIFCLLTNAQACKLACAYSELERAQSHVFEHDIVEPDTAKFGAKKNKTTGERSHRGRLLLMQGRVSKDWIVNPLPQKKTKGKRGMGPESLEEVSGPMTSALGKGVIVSPDGGKAFHSVARKLGKSCLKGVNHQKKVFTPLATLKKSQVDNASSKTLQRQSRGKEKMVHVSARQFKLAAGDNLAEAKFSKLKGNLRRVNGVGRFYGSSEMKSCGALFSAHLTRSPGFLPILACLAKYRKALSNGCIRMSPREAWLPGKCSWLQVDKADAEDS